MPRVFKVPYGRAGERQFSRYWYCRINGKKISLRTSDRRVAEQKAAETERQLLLGWDPSTLDRARRRPITEHLVEFEDDRRNRGTSEKHIDNMVPRLERMIEECGIATIGDIDAQKVEGWLAGLQKHGASTQLRKHIATHCRTFGRWLVATGKIGRNPFEGVRTSVNVQADRKHVRRALTATECQQLLTVVRNGGIRRGHMNAEHRYYLYSLALTTGLRRNELGSLLPTSFDFDATPPAVVLSAASAKNGRAARLPIRLDLAIELRAWLVNQRAGLPVFPVADRQVQLWFYKDLADAGIAKEVDGRVMDFHALRYTFVSLGALAGVSLSVMQKLARHSDPRLTANVYTSLGLQDLSNAVESMPALGRGGSKG